MVAGTGERFAHVTNNVTEFLAMLFALEAMEWLNPTWSGKIYTDSATTQCRFARPCVAKMGGLPPDFVERVRAIRANERGTTYHLLAGHPSQKDLRRGKTKGEQGRAVSEHNVWCDLACNREAATFRTLKGRAKKAAFETGGWNP